MSFHENSLNENTLSSADLFELIVSDSLLEITTRINDDAATSRDYLNELLKSKNKFDHTPIDLAIILGKFDIFKFLLSKLNELNEVNLSGYSSVHFAVAWRRLEELKLLYNFGFDIRLKTFRNEDPLMMANRYKYDDIIDFVLWANTRDLLINYINDTRNLFTNTEKSQGRLVKDDKKLCESVCTDHDLWIKSNPCASTEDFQVKLEECRNTLSCVWNKINDSSMEA